MKKFKLIVFLTIIIFTTSIAYGQDLSKRIRHTTVSIFNNSDRDINVRLGLTIEDLRNYLIKAQEKWISPTYPLNSKPLLIIKTGNIEAKYTLTLNKTYMIFWHNRKKYWDLTRVKSKSGS